MRAVQLLLFKKSDIVLHLRVHVLTDDINMGLIQNVLKISLFWWNFIQFSLKLVMVAFVFIQNIYIYDVTNKYTYIIKFILKVDAATTIRAKNWTK